MNRMFLALLSLSLLAVPIRAQERPNLSGTWTLDPDRSESLASGASPPSTLVIEQGETELAIEAVRGSQRETLTYGFERLNRSGDQGGRLGKWGWDGPRLVTDRNIDVQGQTVTARQIYSLAASGAELSVETIVEVQHGYTLRGTKNYASARDVYTRVSKYTVN